MSIWFVLWLVLSGTLLYFLGWTLSILYRQKKAWRAFADAHKLRYRSPRMFSSPEISGVMGRHTVDLFTGEHVSADIRRTRKLSAIEVKISSKVPFTGGAASGDMVQVLRGLAVHEEFRPAHKGWQDAWIAAASNRAELEAYLTPARLEALVRLMKIRNAWIILVFKGDIALLRLDTPDPLDSQKKLNAVMKRLLEAAAVLELAPGEAEALQSVHAQKIRNETTLRPGPADADIQAHGLRLEEDEEPPGTL